MPTPAPSILSTFPLCYLSFLHPLLELNPIPNMTLDLSSVLSSINSARSLAKRTNYSESLSVLSKGGLDPLRGAIELWEEEISLLSSDPSSSRKVKQLKSMVKKWKRVVREIKDEENLIRRMDKMVREKTFSKALHKENSDHSRKAEVRYRGPCRL